jgi:23S rRNA pseudouridine2604 synthase
MEQPEYPMRINKYLAQRGYSTRKDADTLIARGSVLVNGTRAVLGQKVSEHDRVEVRGKQAAYRYFAYNKPMGVVTHSAQYGEDDVVKRAGIRGVFPIGRLDKRSHGLIILTDDARITDKLLNPIYDHTKEYLVRTREELPKRFKMRMEAGIEIDGETTKKCSVEIRSPHSFSIILTEGKKHQIRRMCAALRVDVADLERTKIMNVRLGDLAPGEHRPIEGKELRDLLMSLGLNR